MKERVLILEDNLPARQNILRKSGAESHARKRARQYRNNLEDADGEDDGPLSMTKLTSEILQIS